MKNSASQIQHRHFLNAPLDRAHTIYGILDDEFEEDGIPVSMFVVDEPTDLWCISIYSLLDHSDTLKARMAKAICEIGIEVEIQCEIIAPTDWVKQTLRQLSPVRAGRFVVHGSHDADAARFNDYGIKIDAGLAFGTGHHGTTAGCLQMLGEELKRRKYHQVLDLGTGSGVLAIAIAKASKAGKAGKTKILASDIDPVATKVARQNAQLNGVGNQLTCITASGFNHREITARAPFDLIIANILALPLQKMAVDFSHHLANGATIILSGLLPHQKARIVAAFRIQGMHLVRSHIRDGWLILVMRA